MLDENALSETLDLGGTWDFTLGDQSGKIHVPGAWEAQGYDKYLDGPATYHRAFRIPDAWAGRRLHLQIDAASYYAAVAIDGRAVGAHRGLWTPFAFDVTGHVTPGQAHDLSLAIYKPGERFPMRESLAGFLPDVCTTFGGIWQPARLVAHAAPSFSDVHLAADADSGLVRARAQVNPTAGPTANLVAALEIADAEGRRVAATREAIPALTGPHALDLALTVPDFRRWMPDAPHLYTAMLSLAHGDQVIAAAARRFGFRKLTQQGDQLLFNDTPVCLRGLLSWGWYPDLLCPAPDAETVRDEFRRAREMGFNTVKLCLFVPSPTYFEVADEEGMFLWLELPMWLPQVTPTLRAQAPVEYADILARVHHHPSVVIYSLGCELNRSVDAELLGRLDGIARAAVSGALLCDNSGSGEAYGGLSADFADFSDYHFYCDLQYFDPLVDHFRRDWRPPRPWIFGEFCDSDDYRDPGELARAHGGALPWWFGFENPILSFMREAQRRQIERVAGLGWSHQDLQRISRRQSLMVRKTIVEKVRRRAGMGGYVITGFRDTPIATSALFDDLGRAKNPPEDVRAFNADTVLALDQGRLRTWFRGGDRPRRRDLFNHVAGEPVSLNLILAHAGAPLAGASVSWRVSDGEGNALAEDERALPGPLTGVQPIEAAPIVFAAPEVVQAMALTLDAQLRVNGEATTANRWTLWVYPKVEAWPEGIALYDPAGCLDRLDDLAEAATRVSDLSPPPGLLIAAGLPSAASGEVGLPSAASGEVGLPPGLVDYLRGGGLALLLQTGPGPLAAEACPFWRESIKLIAAHPVMDAMPHAGFADAQFYSLATDWALATGALARALPGVQDITPLLARLDARLFTQAHYLVEARLGAGRVMASTLRFQGGLGDQPTGLRDNPAGRFLLGRILDHLRGWRAWVGAQVK